jgi:transketolase
MSDGEHQEGQTWEAIMSAHKFQLQNLIIIVDYNGLQIEGTTDEVMPLGDLAQKYRDFGWEVRELDGHDFVQIQEALQWAERCQAPVALLARTHLGRGISFMEDNWKYHDWSGKPDDIDQARKELSTHL